MMPPGYEADLTKLIKMRLYGEALKCVSKKTFYSIDELGSFFDKFFSSCITFHELNGDLARVN